MVCVGVIPRAIWQVRKAAFDDEWDEHLRDFDRVVRWVENQPWADKTRCEHMAVVMS